MRNFIKTLVLFIGFIIGGIIFQISCSNSDEAAAPAISNKILFTKNNGTSHTLWYCDLDGANVTQVPLNLPSNTTFQWSNANVFAKFSPNGQKIIFVAKDNDTFKDVMYSCNLDGSNLQAILSPSDAVHLLIGDIN